MLQNSDGVGHFLSEGTGLMYKVSGLQVARVGIQNWTLPQGGRLTPRVI